MDEISVEETSCQQTYAESLTSGHSSCNSSDLNEISVHHTSHKFRRQNSVGLKYLPTWPPVDIEFHDLTLAVPDLSNGNKLVLRGVNGQFRSHELTAIMGPSGSGKTTLLNILAGYKSTKATGEVTINNRPRNLKVFRKMSRYIMQNEVLEQHCTVKESMFISAHLKLGNELSMQQKTEVIDEILGMLRLKTCENTTVMRLSGGEKKRLSIALELVNNPPVIFLDEPTTGLDDLSSSQCISLLRRLAHSGRTVICSIHTPSAKLFQMFDNVYILAEGQCVYQGSHEHIVPYMETIGLSCPVTHNPADFIIEVAAREYGNEYVDKMCQSIENGNCLRWTPSASTSSCDAIDVDEAASNSKHSIEQFEEEINPKLLNSKSTWWLQFRVLLRRMLVQMWRDKSYIRLKFLSTMILGFTVGGLFEGVGNDATKALFNFGFAFTVIISYLYMPMMPILLQFPTEIRLLKREYFNQWYRLSSYYAAMMCAKLPVMLILAVIYITMIYLLSSQPLELHRFLMVLFISILVAMTSDSLGVLISSRLSIVNAMFVGPALSVPIILLSCYGIGYGKDTYIPPLIKFAMSMSYLRHALEAIVAALYGYNRQDSVCPDTEIFCMFKKTQYLLSTLGFEDVNFVASVCYLFLFYVVFTIAAFLMIKQRLNFSGSNHVAVQYIGQFVKNHFNFSSYNY